MPLEISQNPVFAATCHLSATTLDALCLKAFPVIGGRVADKTRKFRCVAIFPHGYAANMTQWIPPSCRD